MPEEKTQPKEEVKEELKKKEEKLSEKPKKEEKLSEKPKKEEKLSEKPKKEEKPKGGENEEKTGIVHIYGSYNNTIVHITDLAGNTISRVSGGMVTKHSRLKANPTNAMFVAKRAAERAKDLGINALYVRTKGKTRAPGLGPGAHAAIRALGKEGFRIISIMDVTRYPRGGPKAKGGKRGRRV